MMQAPPEAFDSTVQYVRICGAGTLFIIAFNVLGGVFGESQRKAAADFGSLPV